ncbi:hypothetical protein LCGC14_1323760 [marine sediment metagenome]|uniref:DOD-type homing endonuclease domain-containing protein n=1 Tax=marine sediment metagenome TaxID=412755 RepID=A0A0F9KJ76_9ZZZZ
MTVCITNSRLVEIYEQTQSIRETGKKLGISHETVRYKLKKLGITNKPVRYTCNDNYFQSDLPDVFYWAGFIAADGCVKLNNKKYKQLSIGLSQKDHYQVEKFKKAIDFNGPVHKITSQGYDRSEISISSAQLFDDLSRFNIVPRKSLIYMFPEWLIDHSLVNHFMRGYNDGDGSFYLSLSKGRTVEQLYIALRGTKKFLTTYKQILEQNCKLRKSDKKPRLNSGIYTLEYGGTRAVGQIRDFLYKGSDNNIRLDRKYIISHDARFMNIPENYRFKKQLY